MNNNDYEFEKALYDSPELYNIFHHDSKYDPPQKNPPNKQPVTLFKSYPRFPLIKLPKPTKSYSDLDNIMINRKSVRNFHNKLTLKDISKILYFSLGLYDYSHPYTSKRFHPSAGKRYPLEAYVLSLNSSLSTGGYHYNIKTHNLEELVLCNKGHITELFSEEFIQNASIIICLSSVFRRSTSKYSDRGYRFSLIESGHVGQNIHLSATALNKFSCPIGGFYDEKINNFFKLFPLQEAIIYTYAIG